MSRFSYRSNGWKSTPHSPHLKPRRPHSASTKQLIQNLILVGIALAIAGSIVLAGLIAFTSRDLPNPNSLTQRSISQTTKIYDRTGTHLLREISGNQNRTLKKVQQGFCLDDKKLETDPEGIPLFVLQATISVEDRSFCTHGGFDLRGIARALLHTLIGKREGGSTLTQQLVKNAILSNEKTLTRKIKELLLSIELERRYSKDQILQIYLNEIPYGSTYYGIEAAAQNYFGKTVRDLTLGQAATLAALPQAPTTYLNNPEKLRVRRDFILNTMKDLGYITDGQRKAAMDEKTPVQIKLTNIQAPHFVFYIQDQLEAKYGRQMMEEGGLKVTTTLNYDDQVIAEDEVKKGVEARGVPYGFSNAALVAIDPKSGQILSMVGSKDFFDTTIDGQENVALDLRQPGSSFKPIVYTKAFALGYPPSTVLWDVVTNFPTVTGTYTPHDYDLKERGPIHLRDALQESLNIPAVKMIYMVGVETALDFATSLGYTSFADHSAFGPSVILGGGEVKLLEHVNAYATFANEGVHFDPVSILKVEDASGNTLEEWKQKDGKKVIEPNVARTISDVLSDNNARTPIFGALSSLQLGDRPVAAKTGTTNDNRDGWLIGYTPSIAAGVWAGNNNNKAMKHNAGGESTAGPIWNAFMKRVLANSPNETFTPPIIQATGKPVLDGELASTQVAVDKTSGKLATEYTPESQKEIRTYAEYHDLLHYVDRADPLGPPPANPGSDPNYQAWETGVSTWIAAQEATTGHKITATAPPTESDTVHIPENFPIVRITSPGDGQTAGRSLTIEATATAPRPLTRMEFYIDGMFLGSDTSSTYSLNTTLPNSIDRGSHTLKVVAYDDVENSGSTTVNVNVTEDPAENTLSLDDPKNGQSIEYSTLPYNVVVSIKHPEQFSSIRVYADPIGPGPRQLIGQQTNPSAVFSTFIWTLPQSGSFALSVEGITKSGQSIKTAGVLVTITPSTTTGNGNLKLF